MIEYRQSNRTLSKEQEEESALETIELERPEAEEEEFVYFIQQNNHSKKGVSIHSEEFYDLQVAGLLESAHPQANSSALLGPKLTLKGSHASNERKKSSMFMKLVSFTIEYCRALLFVYGTPILMETIKTESLFTASFVWSINPIITFSGIKEKGHFGPSLDKKGFLRSAFLLFSCIGVIFLVQSTKDTDYSIGNGSAVSTGLVLFAFIGTDLALTDLSLISEQLFYPRWNEECGLASFFGAVSSYVICALPAFDLEFVPLPFMSFGFGVSLFLSFFIFLLGPKHITSHNQEMEEEIPRKKTKISSLSLAVLLKLGSLFGINCCMLLLTIYTTSWIGMDLLQGDPLSVSRYKRETFNMGVSWGSFALLCLLFCSVFVDILMEKLPKRNKAKTTALGALNIFAGTSLLAIYFFREIRLIFFVIPACGSVHSATRGDFINEILADDIFDQNKRAELLSRTNSLAELFMLSFVPFVFYFYPEVDDLMVGLVLGGFFSFISGLGLLKNED